MFVRVTLSHAADLIMLGLATHEPYFTILREEFKLIQKRPCEICDQYGHEMQDCTGAAREKKGEVCTYILYIFKYIGQMS